MEEIVDQGEGDRQRGGSASGARSEAVTVTVQGDQTSRRRGSGATQVITESGENEVSSAESGVQ